MSIGLVTGQHAFTQQASGTSISAQFPSDITLGNMIIVGVSNFLLPGSFSVSDDCGNTYTAVGSSLDDGSPQHGISQVFYAVITATEGRGNPPCTVTVSGLNSSNAQLHIAEFTGVLTLDKFATGTGSGTSISSSSTSTTSQANELVYGFIAASAPSSITSLSSGAGFTNIDTNIGSGSAQGLVAEYEVVSSTGSYAATGSGSGAKGSGYTWGSWVVTFYGPFSATVNLTGVSSSTAIGSTNETVTKIPTGVTSATHVGTLTVTGSANVTLTGVSSTSHVGVPRLPVGAIGVSATALVGAVSVHGDANATGSIAPVATHVGTLTITGTAALTLTGVSSSVLVGAAFGEVKVSLAGVSSTSHIGSSTTTLVKTLTGIQSTSHVGTLVVATTQTVNLAGIQVTCSVGLPLVECNSAFPMIAFLGI